MIQLATDPNASRSTWRPAAPQPGQAAPRQARSGHAWPFISRYTERPASPQDPQRTRQPASGS